MRRRDEAADHANAPRGCRNTLHALPVVFDKGGAFDHVASGIATDGKFRKDDQVAALRTRAGGEIYDLGSIAGKIADRGVDLAQGYLHYSSVKPRSTLKPAELTSVERPWSDPVFPLAPYLLGVR